VESLSTWVISDTTPIDYVWGMMKNEKKAKKAFILRPL